MTKHEDERFTTYRDLSGVWLVFDNEDFYCCYTAISKQDATMQANKLNAKAKAKASEREDTELVRLRKENAELKKENKGLLVALSMPTSEDAQLRAIRDLEQREYELMDFLDEVDTWSAMNTYAVVVEDFYERIKNLREQAKQLKERTK